MCYSPSIGLYVCIFKLSFCSTIGFFLKNVTFQNVWQLVLGIQQAPVLMENYGFNIIKFIIINT